MENKYPTNSSGKTGEEFLESIASSLRNLPNIKYLANEVSKLKKASKFATASTNTTYGTGGYVTPPPPTRLTNNRISFFGSDMDWHSDIKAAILLSQFPDNTDITDASSKYYFTAIDPNAETSVDTIYKTSKSYLQYVKVPSTPAFSSELLSKLHVNNATDLGTYSKSNSISSQTYISRMSIGKDGDYSELYVGDYASILTNKNNAIAPTAALVLGNLAYTSSAAYKPYVASVIGNDFKLYHKDTDNSFGSSSKIPYTKTKNQWYFNTDDENYIGLTLDTATIIRKGNIKHIWQSDTQTSANPGMHQRYVNGNNMIIGKNGLSIVNAVYNSGEIESLSSINNEFTLTVSNSNAYLSQFGGFLFGSINKPTIATSVNIGDPKSYSLASKIGFDANGLWSSTNLAVNASILGIRAYNDGSSDSIIDSQYLPAADLISSGETDYYRVYINNKYVFYQRLVTTRGMVLQKVASAPPVTICTTVTKLPAPASAYGKVYYDGYAYFRCTQYFDYTSSTSPSSRRQYEWTPIDTSEAGYGVRWGRSKWSSSRYDKDSLSTLRFNGPYDIAMDIPDDVTGSTVSYSRKKFFEDRILSGDNYIGILATNATNVTKDSTGAYLYTQQLSVYSQLPSSATSINRKRFIDFNATYNALKNNNYYASNHKYSINVNANLTMTGNNTLTSPTLTVTNKTTSNVLDVTNAATIGALTVKNTATVKGDTYSSKFILNTAKNKPSLNIKTLKLTDDAHLGVDDAVSININGGAVQYVGQGFVGADTSGTIQDSGGTRWFARPIIICNDAHMPSNNSAGTDDWASVPNGTIAMSI